MNNTKLKTRSIHGKEYVEVNERIRFFRQNHKDWSIKTDVVKLSENEVVISATVLDANDRIHATGLAHEEKGSSNINKTSYVENCETSAIGRALGILGIGIEGSVASFEEVDTAIAKQNAKPMIPKSQAPLAEPEFQAAPRSLEQVAFEVFGSDAELINEYLRHIGWLDNGMSYSDLATEKLEYAIENRDALMVEANKMKLSQDPKVRGAIAKSVGKGAH